MSRWIFSHKCIVYKVFNKFSLLDVPFAFTALFNIISLVSVCVVGGEDDEANKVEFVLIDVSGEFTETLH